MVWSHLYEILEQVKLSVEIKHISDGWHEEGGWAREVRVVLTAQRCQNFSGGHGNIPTSGLKQWLHACIHWSKLTELSVGLKLMLSVVCKLYVNKVDFLKIYYFLLSPSFWSKSLEGWSAIKWDGKVSKRWFGERAGSSVRTSFPRGPGTPPAVTTIPHSFCLALTYLVVISQTQPFTSPGPSPGLVLSNSYLNF